MSPRHFAIHDLWQRVTFDESSKTVGECLFAWFDNFRNREHVQARVYTCRSWRETQGRTAPLRLGWNDELPDETLLGTFGAHFADPSLVAIIEGELGRGEAVRIITFDSDADLRSDHVLLPLSAQR